MNKTNKSKTTILGEIARNRLVEDIVSKVAKGCENAYNLNDLCQDIYMTLLEKDEDLIVHLYEDNQMNYYISRIATNNIYSKNSPYYQIYKRFDNKTSELNYSDSDDEEDTY